MFFVHFVSHDFPKRNIAQNHLDSISIRKHFKNISFSSNQTWMRAKINLICSTNALHDPTTSQTHISLYHCLHATESKSINFNQNVFLSLVRNPHQSLKLEMRLCNCGISVAVAHKPNKYTAIWIAATCPNRC